MTERLTRAHRREIENKTHQKIDLDHLSEFEVEQLVSNAEDVPTIESSSDEEESSEDEEDLDALLDKAQEALKTHSIGLEKKEKPINTKLSQMQAGLSDKELYLKTHSGRSKLVAEAVELLSPGEKPSSKTAVVLKESKDDDSKKMNRKQRQLVSPRKYSLYDII